MAVILRWFGLMKPPEPTEEQIISKIVLLSKQDDLLDAQSKLAELATLYSGNPRIQAVLLQAETDLTISEIASRINHLSIEDARKELADYKARFTDNPEIQMAVGAYQTLLKVRECFQEVVLLQTALQRPKLTSEEYGKCLNQLSNLIKTVRTVPEGKDRLILSNLVLSCRESLKKLNPSAWKARWVGTGALSLAACWYAGVTLSTGLMGTAVALLANYGIGKCINYFNSSEVPSSPCLELAPILEMPLSPHAPDDVDAPPNIGMALPPIGIPNRGNTCFLAAALQAEVFTNPLIERALWSLWKKGGSPFSEIAKLILAYRTAQSGLGSPDDIHADECRYSLDRAGNRVDILFRGLGQEDASEVLACIMGSKVLQEEIRLLSPEYFCRKTVTRTWSSDEVIPHGLHLAYAKNTEDDDYGDLAVAMPAAEGGRLGPMICCNLEEQERLKDGSDFRAPLLDQYDFPVIGDDHQPRTLSVRNFTQTSYWDHAPPQLLISLKRWRWDETTEESHKNIDSVDVPAQLRLPARFFGDRSTPKMYELTSFIRHKELEGEEPTLASPKSGHYTAYAKINGRYWLMDDGKPVQEITQQEFLDMAKTSYRFRYVPV